MTDVQHRWTSNVLFCLIGSLLMHLLHVLVGAAFLAGPGAVLATGLALVGAYTDRGSRDAGTPSSRRRLLLSLTFFAIFLGPELIEETLLGGPLPRLESA